MALALPSPQRRAAPEAVHVHVDHPAAGMYYTNVSIGTPPQYIPFVVDTGSDLDWVIASDANADAGEVAGGEYNPDLSDTFGLLSTDNFTISYLDGSSVTGDWFTDRFDVGTPPASVQNLAIGLPRRSDSDTRHKGMLGLSPDWTYPLPNGRTLEGNSRILHLMVEQQIINTRSFSLSLGHHDDARGSLLFGAHDPGKYHGDLTILPMRKDPNLASIYHSYRYTPVDYRVDVSSVVFMDTINGAYALTPQGYIALGLMDSGAEVSTLPRRMFMALVQLVKAYKPQKAVEDWFVDCDNRNYPGSLDFEFGNLGKSSRISVPLKDIILPAFDWDTRTPILDEQGVQQCRLMFIPGKNGVVGLNQPFLRAAYVVHHLDERVLGIAQATDDVDQVVEIASGDSKWQRPG